MCVCMCVLGEVCVRAITADIPLSTTAIDKGLRRIIYNEVPDRHEKKHTITTENIFTDFTFVFLNVYKRLKHEG